MRLLFRQGIVRYPYSGSIQQFLAVVGSDVGLKADNGPIEVTLAHRNTNYLHIENATIDDAWPSFAVSTDQWLYWDINLTTGARTFGSTLIEPVFGPTEPVSPVADLHWYDTTNEIMFVYQSGAFVEVVRVFAAKFDGVTTFTSLSAGLPNLSFAGSQVGITNFSNLTGRIVFDDSGAVIKRSSGELFTTEDQFFATGSRVNSVRLESNINFATANVSLGAYNIVKYVASGKVSPAGKDDVGNTVLGVVTEGAGIGDSVSVILQGIITNPSWNWTDATIGNELWVSASGTFTQTDPNVSGTIPVARILSRTEIIFEQGLGGIGKTGPAGVSANATPSTISQLGVVFLSAAPDDPESPIAVGTNDSRLTDARAPTAHNQAASTITFTPYGDISSATAQLAIQELDDEKLSLAGGTLTGFLTLNADPTNVLHAATKQYVDGLVSGLNWQDPVHFINLIDDSLTTAPTLTAADASNVYITDGIGGAWSGFPIGSVVIWDGSSWYADIHEGLLSNHSAGTRFGIAMESTTTPGGTFVGKKDYIYVLDDPATPTWSFIAPTGSAAVFVNNDESLHAYHQYVYSDYLTKWVEISGAGVVVTASEVDFTPVGNIAATDVQAALAELDTEKSDTAHTHVIPYDLAAQVVGLPDASAVVLRFVSVRAFTIETTGHQAKADTASTGTAVFDVQLNGGSVASITFTTSATGVVTLTGSPIVSVSVVAGDVITIVAPGSQDATLADIGVTINSII